MMDTWRLYKKKGCRYKAMNDRPEVPIAKWMDCSRVAWVITSYLSPGNSYNTDGWCLHWSLFLTLKFLYHLRFIKSHQSPVSDSQNHCTYNWKHFMTLAEQQVEKLLQSLLGSARDQQRHTAWMEFPFRTGLTPLLPPGILKIYIKEAEHRQWCLSAWILIRYCSKHGLQVSVSVERILCSLSENCCTSSHIRKLYMKQ